MDFVARSSFDEKEWVVRIRRNLDEELEDETEVPVTIFNVPKPLLLTFPNSYVPQQIAIGPYNYCTLELREMERYKVAAVKRIQKKHPGLKFHDLVDQFKKHDQRIRAHYQRYLELNCDTLAWIMAVDTSFLLEFLLVYCAREVNKELVLIPSIMSHFIDYAGTKSAHNAIVRDIVMLENQIPLFLLRKVLEFQYSSLDSADESLVSMVVGFCREVSPFKGGNINIIELPNALALVAKCAHLLDFLYHTILPELDSTGVDAEVDEEQDEAAIGDDGGRSFKKSSDVRDILHLIWTAVSNLNIALFRIIKQVFFSKPVEFVSKLPWSRLSSFPGMKRFSDPVESMFSSTSKGKADAENESSKATGGGGGGNFQRPPSVEEISIPSVTELSEVGVKFAPTTTGIYGINFDPKIRTLFLPMVSLDINSEVVFRNLVAYEACSGSRPLVFTRYTELMNGIIDSDNDVKILRQNGIVVNRLKRDSSVTKLWNGMSRSIRLTKVDFLDKTIGDVNKYYNGRWKIKFKRVVTRYVFESWKILTFFAAVLMLLFMGVQAFCSVYSCPRLVNDGVQNLHR